MPKHTNRLAHETSPYLLQHAHNPVDWYPWGPEALQRARDEGKPILLSIGYSACHWCHVMERESFENEDIARLMNQHFVNIKVDREERPDLDHIYMSAVQMLTGRGGWPLTVFLTPEGKPFFGGTYFPPEDRHNMPGFPRVLTGIANAFVEKSGDVQTNVERLLTGLAQQEMNEVSDAPLDTGTVAQAAAALAQHYDAQNGGLGGAPKFPHEAVLELFLRSWHASRDARTLEMVTHTLRKMAAGGIYDHLGGGFHRYSVDAHWLVPHFEKMLYDNAQLTVSYLDTYRATGDAFFADVARDILRYVRREMRHPEGGFFSTQDADTDGEEGQTFLWSAKEVREILGDDADLFCRLYDVTDAGNFEHRNILHRTLEMEQLAKLFRLDVGEVERRLDEARRKLLAVREKRAQPGRDEKVLTSWNALMISAFARAASVLGDADDLLVAREAAHFLFDKLWNGDRLLSTYKDGKAKLNGYLDDYAFLSAALLDVFEASQDRRYLDDAVRLVGVLLERFWDDSEGGFFFTSSDHEQLVHRSKPTFDGSIPSGNSVAASVLLRLYHLTGTDLYLTRAEQMQRLFYRRMREQPFAMANMLCALDFYLRKPKEIVIVGPPGSAATRELIQLAEKRYLPNRVLSVVDPASGKPPPMLEGKGQVDGKVTAYVCEAMTCSLPATTPEELAKLL